MPKVAVPMSFERRCLAWLLSLLALLPPAGVAHAERHALLVGVSRYALFAGDERMQLSGPRNDVQLLRTLLEQRGFAPQAVRVLADGVTGSAEPTRAAILSSLDQLVERSQPGDFVFLYFAGHGSQMPADAGTPEGRAESDGLHEIFLPADVGRWNDGMRRVENAIADHELVRRLDALLAKEVFVWAVFDTCHAATLARGVAEAGMRNRHVLPSALGIPQASPDRAAARAAAAASVAGRGAGGTEAPGLSRVTGQLTRSAISGPGGFVLFYAAQTTQTTPEMRLPAGQPEGKVYGLFSYSLAEALSSAQGASYRQLAQHVLGRYAAQNLQTPTPLFTGTRLDAPLFGTRVEQSQRQWPVRVTPDGVILQAGLLSQLQVGTELDLLPDPLSRPGDRLGTMHIARAELMSSWLVPVAVPGEAPVDPTRLARTAVARLVRPLQPVFQLRVLAPAGTQDADDRAVRKAIAAIREGPGDRIDLRWVDAGEAYDLRLHVEGGQVWLLPPSGQWYASGIHKSLSIRIGQPAFQTALADGLWRVGRVRNLLRIAGAVQDRPDARMVQVDASYERGAATSDSLDTLAPTVVGGGGLVRLRVRNIARVAVDLTVLYV
ncbi:MAG: caspase family protein, partial [Rubrivivax sp.]